MFFFFRFFFGFVVRQFGFLFFPFCFFYFFMQFMAFAQGGDMLGVFLSHVGGEVRAISGAAGFDLGNIFLAETGSDFGMSFFRAFGFFDAFSRVFLFEDGAADDRIGFRFGGSFFVFGFDEIGR